MKTCLLIVATMALCSPSYSQPRPGAAPTMPLNEVLGPDNSFNDTVYGVAFTYPAGWRVRSGERWNWEDERENSLMLSPPSRLHAITAVYYQLFSENVPGPESEGIETFLRKIAERKAEAQAAAGLKDYKNLPDSFVFSETGGRATLKNSASYIEKRKPSTEYFVRIFGARGYVIFCVQGPVPDVKAVVADVDRMAASVHGSLLETEGIYKDSVDWFLRGN